MRKFKINIEVVNISRRNNLFYEIKTLCYTVNS